MQRANRQGVVVGRTTYIERLGALLVVADNERMARRPHPRWLPWLLALVSLVLIGGIGLITRASLAQLDESMRWQRHASEIAQSAQILLGSLTDTQRGMRGYILSGRSDALALYRGAVAGIRQELPALQRLLGQNADGDIQHVVDAVLSYAQELLDVQGREGLQGAVRLEAGGRGLTVMNQARLVLQSIATRARSDLENRIAVANADLASSRRLATIGLILAIALLLLGNLILANETRRGRSTARSLQLSEQRLRLFMDGVKDYALIMLDGQGAVLSWNAGARRMYGYTTAEILGKSFSCCYPKAQQDLGHAARELRVAAREGRYEEQGIRIRKDGTQFLASVVITSIRQQDGMLSGFAKITRDITEAHQRDQALEEQARILDLANDTIFVRDDMDRITYWNQGAQRVYGWSREEALGQVTHELLKTRFPHGLGEIRSILSRSGHWEGELEHMRKDGTWLTVASRWTLRRDAAGATAGVIEMNHDITERKQFAEALQHKNAELLQASRAKDEFLANMSHELRTPLNGVIGFAEILADGLPGAINAKQREYLGDILASGRHLLQLINDVLDLAKVGAGKMELYPEPFTLAEAIAEDLQVVRPAAERKGLRLRVLHDGELQSVCLDRQRFKQILWNLLSNAVKFTDSGGTVEIITARAGSDRFSLSVRDTGIGIAPGDVERIFNDFEQVDGGAARRYQGTGLGLALTRKLILMQGGDISVRSLPGAGATFTVELPRLMTVLY
jgi:PAS domain S-box-containing protein